jgi:hypothetical protein
MAGSKRLLASGRRGAVHWAKGQDHGKGIMIDSPSYSDTGSASSDDRPVLDVIIIIDDIFHK